MGKKKKQLCYSLLRGEAVLEEEAV